MLPTEPVFQHPTQSHEPDRPDGVCEVCGARNDRAIHDWKFAQRTDLWGGRQWWPRARHSDGGESDA